MNPELTDPAIALVAAARMAETAYSASLAAGSEEPDTADGAIYDALKVVPTTLEGIREKLAMAIDIEAVNWPEDATMLLRSLLASPAIPPASACVAKT